MPKTMIRTMPVTNSGTIESDSPVTVIVRSAGRPTWSAAKTPPMMLSGMTMTNATAASLSELTSAWPMRSDTGTLKTYDVPMSPCRKPQSQSQ